MWKVQSIEAKDFMSFEKFSFDFENKCYVIRAENKDDNGQKSNGSGKTSFVDVIAVALLGYSLTGRNVKDCVRWTSPEDYFTVKLNLINTDHKLECSIERKVYSKSKSAELKLLVNGAVPKTIPTKQGVENGVDIREGNKYILTNILDITEEDLLNYFLISKINYKPFLEVNTDRKLEVMGRFTNTKAVDKTIGKLEVEVEETHDNINEYNDLIQQAHGYIKALEDSLNEDKAAEFEQDKQAKLDELFKKSDQVEKEIVTMKRNIAQHEAEIEVTLAKKVDVNDTDRSELVVQITSIEKEISENDLIKLQLLNSESKISKYLAGLVKCPKCKNEFPAVQCDEHYTKQDLKLENENISLIEGEIQALKKIKFEAKERLKVITDAIAANVNLDKTVETLKRNKASIEKHQKRLMDEFSALEQSIATESARTFQDERADVGEQIEAKRREIKSFEVQLEELKTKLDKDQKWIEHFENFKFYLGNKPTNIICSLVNQYLELASSELNLHIEGFKKLKNGELRQSLNPVIYRNWINPQSVQQYSEGERVRLNLATDLAFQQLINGASKFGGFNLYANDEMISGLDSLGVQLVAEAFNSLDKTMLLVTHSGADMNYQNSIIITKKNGKSEVV